MSQLLCNCGGETRVIDTRRLGNDNAIIRRRKCGACQKRFTTLEHTVENSKRGRNFRATAVAMHLSRSKGAFDPLIEQLETLLSTAKALKDAAN